MRYLLVVGFACDVYRREPRARIFVGNRLIDEFFIVHHKPLPLGHLRNPALKDKHILQPFSWTEYANNRIKNFPPLRFYEIEIDQQQNLKLLIDIKNNDSNYLNGFMTASTTLTLQVFYFFPLNKKILYRLNEIQKKRLIKNYAWFRNYKNIIFNINTANLKWYGENKVIVDQEIRGPMDDYSIGGSGYFTCELIKKYGIFLSKVKEFYKLRFSLGIDINYLVDKYQQYVNQRNCN